MVDSQSWYYFTELISPWSWKHFLHMILGYHSPDLPLVSLVILSFSLAGSFSSFSSKCNIVSQPSRLDFSVYLPIGDFIQFYIQKYIYTKRYPPITQRFYLTPRPLYYTYIFNYTFHILLGCQLDISNSAWLN